ncbi:Uncharacterised protein [Mycobacteroides abscessus subsp. abscessus]|nr:Uncharacterised protein [Mycobacteroides abscessus subsp. abscessus]
MNVRSPEKLPSPFGMRKSDLAAVTVPPAPQWNG